MYNDNIVFRIRSTSNDKLNVQINRVCKLLSLFARVNNIYLLCTVNIQYPSGLGGRLVGNNNNNMSKETRREGMINRSRHRRRRRRIYIVLYYYCHII